MRSRNLLALGVVGVAVAFGGLAIGFHLMHGPMGMDCGPDGCANADPVRRDGNVVDMQNNRFHPPALLVDVGDTVTWQNRDGFVHTIDADDGAWSSGNVGPRGAWNHTFTEPGTYTYHCEPHAGKRGDGSWAGMVGRIVVQEPDATGT